MNAASATLSARPAGRTLDLAKIVGSNGASVALTLLQQAEVLTRQKRWRARRAGVGARNPSTWHFFWGNTVAPSIRIFELKGRSPADLFTLIEAQPGDYRHLFRGQTNAAWGLVPALYRTKDMNIGAATLEEKYDLWEVRSLELFFDEGLPYLPPIKRSYSNDRILAQHFGVPTRLLDWSRDPLVATFFAVEEWHTDADAALFMILPDARHRPEDVKSLGAHKAIELQPPRLIDGYPLKSRCLRIIFMACPQSRSCHWMSATILETLSPFQTGKRAGS